MAVTTRSHPIAAPPRRSPLCAMLLIVLGALRCAVAAPASQSAESVSALSARVLGNDHAAADAAIGRLREMGPGGVAALRVLLPQVMGRDAVLVLKESTEPLDPAVIAAGEKELAELRKTAWTGVAKLTGKSSDPSVKVAQANHRRLDVAYAKLATAYAKQARVADAVARHAARLDVLHDVDEALAKAADLEADRVQTQAEKAIALQPQVIGVLRDWPINRPPDDAAQRGVWFWLVCRRVEAYNRTFAPLLHAQELIHAEHVNHYRELLGITPLELDVRLIQSARRHSREMMDKWYFSHYSPVPELRTPWHRMRAAGYPQAANENIHAGRWTGEEAFWKLFNSPPHHRVIVMPAYAAFGVGKWENAWTESFGVGPRLMLGTDEQRAAVRVVGEVVPPQDVEKMRANQRDLGTMKTYDIFGNERPIQGPVE